MTREELRNSLWSHDTYVDFDHSLNISINKLREALGDSEPLPVSSKLCHDGDTGFWLR